MSKRKLNKLESQNNPNDFLLFVYLFLCDVIVNRLELSDYEHLHICINYLFFCQIKKNEFFLFALEFSV